jgi:hypothetical protein
MRWRLFAVLCMLTGLALLAFGIWIEIEVRRQKGSGLWNWLAHVFYTSDIERYRGWSFHLLAIGPGVLVLGIGVWAWLSWRAHSKQMRAAEKALDTLGPRASRRAIESALGSTKVRKALIDEVRRRAERGK